MTGIHVNNIANEAGTGGPDFVGMPSVAGDPVVESGSNSDGWWTRWADGTQICQGVNADFAYESSSYLLMTANQPSSFVGDPIFSHPVLSSSSGNYNELGKFLNYGHEYIPGSGSLRMRYNETAGVWVSGDFTVNASYIAVGRWK